MFQVKTCFDCKMLDVTNWVVCLNGENGPGGTPSHEALSVSPQRALEISSFTGQPPSLDRSHFSSSGEVAESHKRDERCRPSSQRPVSSSLQTPQTKAGALTYSKPLKRPVVRQGKKATHKCPRTEGSFSGPSKFQGPVSKPNCVCCNGQLNSGSLNKQIGRNLLSTDVRSSVEDHDLVPSLQDNLKSQTHSRVSECDCQPFVQVDRMVTASIDTQTDLSKVVHPSCRSIFPSSEPQTSTIHVSSSRLKCLGHRCPKLRLDGPHCLCLPSYGSPSQGDTKVKQCHCLIIVIATGWPGMTWF